MPPRVIIWEGRGPDKGALRTVKGTDKRRHSRFTDSGGTLPQKSATGSWHMPERHNGILLGAGTGGGIKGESGRNTHTLFFYTHYYTVWLLVVLWPNLIVGVQTAARGAVCVFCRSRLEILEKVLRVILQRTQSRKRFLHARVVGRINIINKNLLVSKLVSNH